MSEHERPEVATKPSRIEIESMVASRSREPFVVLRWGNESGQLTPSEARQHARRVLEAAEAADQDAFLVWWLTEKVHVDHDRAGLMLVDYRSWRAKRDEEIDDVR